MSIASRITSIEGHISDIYDSVELTGVDTTDIDKNLVNVPNTLKEGYIDIINNGTDTLYNNFPKVSGEGTSLTLNNTYQAPMRNNLKGNTSQTGTPTPSNPINVAVVSGDNSVNIQNKNLWSSVWEQGTINSSGDNDTSSNCIRTKDFIPVIPNQHYAIKRSIYTSYINVRCYDSNKNYLGAGSSYINLISGTSSSNPMGNSTDRCVISPKDNVYYIRINDFTNNLSTQYMMVKGDTQVDYEPFSIDTYPINLPVENLFNETLLSQESSYNTYNSSTGLWTTNSGGGYSKSILYNASGNNNNRDITKLVPLQKNTQYTLYLYDFINNTSDTNYLSVALFDNTGTQINTSDTKNNYTFTTPSQDCYLDIRRGANSGYFTFSHISIYKGSKANSYTPYGTTPIEMCSIPNTTYKDLFKRSTGKNLAPINLESETYNTLQITNNNNGTFTLYGNPTGSFGRDIATNLTLKAGTYTISANAMPSGLYIALDNEADTQLSSGTLSKTFTLASDTTYTSLGIWFTKNKDYDVTIKLQIEKSGSATEWQPKEGWYLHKEVGKVVYTGDNSEGWTGPNSVTTPTNRTTVAGGYGYIKYSNNNYLSNYFIKDSTTSNRIVLTSSGASSIVYMSLEDSLTGIASGDSEATKLQKIKTWLASNNTTVYYVLATPTSEGIPTNLINQLEDLYIAQSKNNQTNISQINNDLPFIVSASALKKGV